jgi:stringent starvation protein B
MSISISTESQGTSTRPYLIRALHDWCTDNGFTPYLAVHVDETVDVPREYVKNNEIVLNVGFEATSGLELGNEFIEFKARFGGVARDISVPVDHVVAIYARENGQGMAFPMPPVAGTGPSMGVDEEQEESAPSSATGASRAAPRLAAISSGRSESSDAVDLTGPDDHPEPPGPDSPTGRPALKRIK